MNKILRYSLMSLLTLFCGTMFAQTTFDFPTLYGSATISDISNKPQTVDGITVSFAKGNANNNPAYNKAGEVRLYGGKSDTMLDGCTMTFKSTTGNMSTIVLTAGKIEKWGTLTANVGTLTEDEGKNVTWTGDASEVVFTASRNADAVNVSTQNRYKSAVVTLAGGVSKKAANLKFSETEVSVEQGKDFTAPTFTKETTAPVSFASDNEGVASVNSEGTITLGNELGTAVITATSQENDEYAAGSATCTIEVFKNIVYKKVSEIKSGNEYLLVAQRADTTYYALPAAEGKTYGYFSSVYIEGNVDQISVKSKYNDGFVFTTEGAGYSIKDSYGRYLYHDGKYNTFSLGADPQAWTVEPQTDGTFKISYTDGYYVQFGDGTYKSFGVYDAAGNNKVLPLLYEKQDGTSGITDVNAETKFNVNAPVYNLAGQRVSKETKGILIQNGKKFLNK